MRITTKRILLTMPVKLLAEADEVAASQHMTRGEFVKQAIVRNLPEWLRERSQKENEWRPKNWSVNSR